MEDPFLLSPSHPELTSILRGIVCVHSACILTDHTLAVFLPPLAEPTMLAWWQERMEEVAAGSRAVIVQMASSSRPSEAAAQPQVAGVVSLLMPRGETGPFRGLVEKLLISPDHRRKGIAKRMMRMLEEVAREQGRTLLVLDTETQSPACQIYPRWGYTELGTIPNYGISPRDNLTLVEETFFWKDLNRSSPL